MPGLDAEAQFKFLLSCIKHSTAGRVNFDAVAKELSIVSKAAAAKRYERLLKAHGISANSAPKDGEDAAKSPRTPKTPKTPSKRKRNPVKDEGDDSEGASPTRRVKKEKAVKAEKVDKVKAEKKPRIKSEHSTAGHVDDDGDEYFSD